MNNKAFTLVEIIAVVTIIGMIALIAFPTITGTLKRSQEKNYQNFEKSLFMATETYIEEAKYLYPELSNIGGTASIQIGTLISKNYIKSSMINPKTNKKIANTSTIKVLVESNGVYSFTYQE